MKLTVMFSEQPADCSTLEHQFKSSNQRLDRVYAVASVLIKIQILDGFTSITT